MDFDDEYPSCQATHATFRVFSNTLNPSSITDVLGVRPSESFAKGEPYGKNGLLRRATGWLLTSRDAVKSRDTRRHIAWILEQLATKGDAVRALRKTGAEIDVSCYYVSVGQGGPTMSAEQMSELGQLGIDVWFDVYFDSAAEDQ